MRVYRLTQEQKMIVEAERLEALKAACTIPQEEWNAALRATSGRLAMCTSGRTTTQVKQYAHSKGYIARSK